MSRQPAVDSSGRPIVAELGRPETPDEAADRKALASAKRRANQTTLNLVLALLASLAVVALVVLVVVRPQSVQRDPVDYLGIASDAQESVDVPLAAPALPDGWSANRAELTESAGDAVQSWQIGFLTPSQQYIGLVQGIDANASWLAAQTGNSEATDRIRIGDTEWRVFDRRDADDPGNLAFALTADFGRSTVVLGGTASDAEFATLAESVAAELAP
ncbi:MAG: DUF4245 domain-containing protein [Pseudolysinimonas sp.]